MTRNANAQQIIEYMESLRNEEQRQVLMGFFKTAPGEYGYGDEFLGSLTPAPSPMDVGNCCICLFHHLFSLSV